MVPEGCLADLSGRWLHEDATWQYAATDDGGTLTLLATRHFVPDAGFRRFGDSRRKRDAGQPLENAEKLAPTLPAPPPAAVVTLVRTPKGFSGVALAQLRHPAGRTCPAQWKTEVLSCLDGGLTLRSESMVALSEACLPPLNPQPTLWLEHRLQRVLETR